MRFCFALLVFVQMNVCSFSFCREELLSSSFRILVIYDSAASKLHKVDAANMKQSLKNIAASLKVPSQIKMIARKKLSMEALQKWSEQIIPSLDVVCVYYSGPQAISGLQSSTTSSIWPSLALTKASITSVPVDTMAKIVHDRKARLSVVFADCYDKTKSHPFSVRCTFAKPLKKTRNKSLILNFRKTWLETKGALTICSHSRGEIGCGMVVSRQYKGGVFTEVLLHKLKGGKLSEFCQDIQHNMKYDLFQDTRPHIACQSSIVE